MRFSVSAQADINLILSHFVGTVASLRVKGAVADCEKAEPIDAD